MWDNSTSGYSELIAVTRSLHSCETYFTTSNHPMYLILQEWWKVVKTELNSVVLFIQFHELALCFRPWIVKDKEIWLTGYLKNVSLVNWAEFSWLLPCSLVPLPCSLESNSSNTINLAMSRKEHSRLGSWRNFESGCVINIRHCDKPLWHTNFLKYNFTGKFTSFPYWSMTGNAFNTVQRGGKYTNYIPLASKCRV